MIKNPYTLALGIAGIFGWTSWLLVLNKLSPFTTGWLSLILFYASLLMALVGTLSLLLFYLRLWRGEIESAAAYFNAALREGILLALMIEVAMVFQRLRVLTWWDALLLFAIVILLEFYFLARD